MNKLQVSTVVVLLTGVAGCQNKPVEQPPAVTQTQSAPVVPSPVIEDPNATNPAEAEGNAPGSSQTK